MCLWLQHRGFCGAPTSQELTPRHMAAFWPLNQPFCDVQKKTTDQLWRKCEKREGYDTLYSKCWGTRTPYLQWMMPMFQVSTLECPDRFPTSTKTSKRTNIVTPPTLVNAMIRWETCWYVRGTWHLEVTVETESRRSRPETATKQRRNVKCEFVTSCLN